MDSSIHWWIHLSVHPYLVNKNDKNYQPVIVWSLYNIFFPSSLCWILRGNSMWVNSFPKSSGLRKPWSDTEKKTRIRLTKVEKEKTHQPHFSTHIFYRISPSIHTESESHTASKTGSREHHNELGLLEERKVLFEYQILQPLSLWLWCEFISHGNYFFVSNDYGPAERNRRQGVNVNMLMLYQWGQKETFSLPAVPSIGHIEFSH